MANSYYSSRPNAISLTVQVSTVETTVGTINENFSVHTIVDENGNEFGFAVNTNEVAPSKADVLEAFKSVNPGDEITVTFWVNQAGKAMLTAIA